MSLCKKSFSQYNGHFFRHLKGFLSKNISVPLLYNGHFGAKTWHPQRKNFFREASHFTTDINCPKRRYRQKKILAPVSQLTFFIGVQSITHESPPTFQRTFSWQMRGIRPEEILIVPHFVTDRIWPKNRGGQETFLRRKPYKQVLGKALPNKIPTGKMSAEANFGTVVKSCS